MATGPFEEAILNEIAEALMDLRYCKPNPSFIPPFPRCPKKKRSRQITLQGIRDFKAIEEKEHLLFQQTDRFTLLGKNGGRNKRKRKSSSGNEGRPSAKRVQTDAPLLSVQPKFNCIEKSGTKLIFRKVDQCSASTSAPVSTAAPARSTLKVQRTPSTVDLNFPPPSDS